jgi:hypothetical protein
LRNNVDIGKCILGSLKSILKLIDCDINALKLTMAPAALSMGEQKMTCAPLGHLRKYRVDDAAATATTNQVSESQPGDSNQSRKSGGQSGVTPLRYAGVPLNSQSDRKPWALRSDVLSESGIIGPDAVYRSGSFPGRIDHGVRGSKRKSGDGVEGDAEDPTEARRDRAANSVSLGNASFVKLPSANDPALGEDAARGHEKQPSRISAGGTKKKRP